MVLLVVGHCVPLRLWRVDAMSIWDGALGWDGGAPLARKVGNKWG